MAGYRRFRHIQRGNYDQRISFLLNVIRHLDSHRVPPGIGDQNKNIVRAYIYLPHEIKRISFYSFELPELRFSDQLGRDQTSRTSAHLYGRCVRMPASIRLKDAAASDRLRYQERRPVYIVPLGILQLFHYFSCLVKKFKSHINLSSLLSLSKNTDNMEKNRKHHHEDDRFC